MKTYLIFLLYLITTLLLFGFGFPALLSDNSWISVGLGVFIGVLIYPIITWNFCKWVAKKLLLN